MTCSLCVLNFFIHFRLKTIDLVIRSTQGAEDVLRKYENQLRDVHKVPANEKDLETNQAQLKVQYYYEAAAKKDIYINCIYKMSGRSNNNR